MRIPIVRSIYRRTRAVKEIIPIVLMKLLLMDKS